LADLVARYRPVGVGYPADSPALDIADGLATAGAPVGVIRGGDWAAACAGWLAAIVEGQMAVGAHPALAAAAEIAPGRDSGDGGWVWTRRGAAASIAPVVAATAAVWALEHPTEPELVARVW
jgi:hypothetical protein